MRIKKLNLLLAAIVLIIATIHATANDKKPIIFSYSEAIQPGETLGLQGAFFGESPQVWILQVKGAEQNLVPKEQLQVLTQSDIYVAAKVPANFPFGLYAIWVKNESGISEPVFVNQARAMTSEFDEIMPGTKFRLFGRNLIFEGYKGSVRFIHPSGSYLESKVFEGDSYSIVLEAPKKLEPGVKYEISVSNGAGGKFGFQKSDESVLVRAKEADPLKLGVPWGADFDFADNVYNVKTDKRLSIKAKGDGEANDRNAIQDAINKASEDGGGVVYLPAGIYKIDYSSGSGITLKSNVVLKGDGKDETTVKYGYGEPFTTERVKAAYGWTLGWPDSRTEGMGLVFPGFINASGLIDLSFVNVNESGSFVHTIKNMPEGGSKVVVKDCGFDFSTGWGLALVNIDKLLISGCELNNQSTDVRGINAPTRTWPLDVKNSINTIIRNNQFNYYAGRFGANGCDHIIYENNTFLRNGDHQSEGETGGINFDHVVDIVIQNNSFLVKGKPIEPRNQGETILSQGGTPNQKDLGIVSSATANTIVDKKKEWQDFTDHASTSWQYAFHPTNYYIAIVDGVGTGQWRTITSNNDTLLTIDQPWDVIPEPGSKYIISHWSACQAIIKDNILKDNHQGIMFYCGGEDVCIVENKLLNSSGIYLRADQRYKEKRYNLLWNILVEDNEIVNDNGLRAAFISVMLAQSKDDKQFGTGALGIEIRKNLVQASIPNVTKSPIKREGYLNYMNDRMSQSLLYNPNMPGILGTIFENNKAINTENAFVVGMGAHQTIIQNNEIENASKKLIDVVNEKKKIGAMFTVSDIK